MDHRLYTDERNVGMHEEEISINDRFQGQITFVQPHTLKNNRRILVILSVLFVRIIAFHQLYVPKTKIASNHHNLRFLARNSI